jgi:hypothetical protein
MVPSGPAILATKAGLDALITLTSIPTASSKSWEPLVTCTFAVQSGPSLTQLEGSRRLAEPSFGHQPAQTRGTTTQVMDGWVALRRGKAANVQVSDLKRTLNSPCINSQGGEPRFHRARLRVLDMKTKKLKTLRCSSRRMYTLGPFDKYYSRSFSLREGLVTLRMLHSGVFGYGE